MKMLLTFKILRTYIGVNENAAYNLHSIDGGEDTQSQNDDTLSYYCN